MKLFQTDFPPAMIQDKSTRFTLFATGILLLVLCIMGWLLSRTASAKRQAAAQVQPPPSAPAVPAPAPAIPADRAPPPPSLPLDEHGQPRFEYVVLTDVTLTDDPANDGDTFLLKTPEGTHRFCLYFVDTVETDGGQPEAARDMAGYFEFDSEEPLRALGLEARDFSLRLLRASSFRVVTRWEKSAEEDAYFAFLYLKDPDTGEFINLAQWLVRYGLARIVACERDQPEGNSGLSAARFREILTEEESRSRTEAHGAWSRKEGIFESNIDPRASPPVWHRQTMAAAFMKNAC